MARITSTSNSNVLNTEFFARRYVERLEANLVVLPLGRHEDAPRHSGLTATWMYLSNPSAQTTALSEGADPPTSTDVTTNVVTAAIAEYGGYIEPAKLFTSSATSGTEAELVDFVAYEAALTLDTLCYSQSLNDSTNTVTEAAVTADIIRIGVQTLRAANAKPHPASPGGRYFCAVMSPEGLFDMMGETLVYPTAATSAVAPTWSQVKITDQGMPGAIGVPGMGEQNATIYGAYIMESTNVSTSAASRDDNYIIAKDGFGTTSIDGNARKPRIIVTSPEQRVDKPLRNAGTVGWWQPFASELIDSNRVYEIQSTQT